MRLFFQRIGVILSDFFRFFRLFVAQKIDFGCSQNKREQALFIELIARYSPKTFMEIGIAEGGNFVDICQSVPSIKTAIGIDLYVRNRFAYRHFIKCALHLRNGKSCSAKTVAWVASKVIKIDLLFIDGDHTYEGVKWDYEIYRHMVRKGGLIAFHDIVPDKRASLQGKDPKGGVPAFWNEIKQGKKFWEFIDDPNQHGMGIGVIEIS